MQYVFDWYTNNPAGIYLLKVDNRNTEQGVNMSKVNNENVVVFLLLTLNVFHTLF